MHPVEIAFLGPFNDLASINIVRKRSHNNTIDRRLDLLGRRMSGAKLWRYFRMQAEEMARDYLINTIEPLQIGPEPRDRILGVNDFSITEFVPEFLDAMCSWACPEIHNDGGIQGAIFKSIETPYIADYEQRFPNMSFLHILRHPYDTWSSLKRTLMVSRGRPMHYLGGDNLISFLKYRWIPHLKFLSTRHNDPRHMTVRYEDLVRDPQSAIKAATQHCGFELPKEPDLQTLLNGRHFKNAQMNPSQKGVRAPDKATENLAELFDYDQVITPREERLIRYCTGNLAAPFGYFADEPVPETETILEDWSKRDKWDSMNSETVRDHIGSMVCRLKRKHYIRSLLLDGSSL